MFLATTTGDFDCFDLSYLEKIKLIHSAGFSYIDLSLYTVKPDDELLISDSWEKTADEMLNFAKEKGIKFIQCHSPNTNPLDEAQLEKAIRLNKRAIEICSKLGIPNMVVHSGWEENISKDEWYRKNKAFFSELFSHMEKYSVNVLHENTASSNIPWFYPKTGKEMREFSEYVNHPRFHSCWDTGHANIEGSQYDEIITLGDDLFALHINDNRGFQDEHIIPFFGTVNMDEIMCALKKINYQGAFTFEAGSSIRPSEYWLGNRRCFKEKTLLSAPPIELQIKLEEFLYSVGKHILSSYGEFEK